MTGTARRRLDAALTSGDPWAAFDELAADPPAGLAGAVRDRFAAAAPALRQPLAALLGRLRDDPDTGPVLLHLIAGARGDDAARLVRAATTHRLAVPDLARLLADRLAREPAIAAAGAAGDPAVVPLLIPHLDTPDARGPAALALARLGAVRCVAAIADRLPQLTGPEHEAFAVALELLGDPAAIGPLRDRVAHAPPGALFGLHHALVRLTGHDPVLPLEPDGWPAAVRQAWAAWAPGTAARPRVEDVELLGGDRARLVVADGRGVIGVDYDPPPPGSAWPRWGKSLLVAGARLYDVGSDCGTCETSLWLIGWPPRPAAALSQRVRDRLGDVGPLTGDVVEAVAPLLTGLRSGHYLVVLADLDLRHVTDPANSWFQRRVEYRTDEDDVPGWPGTGHFQLPAPVAGARPTFAVVLPSRDLSAVDARTVAAHADTIGAGRRPAAVVTAWVEDREVRMEHPERFLVGVVLDGHHKLVAYARAGVPARVLLLCRIEDSWGPPADRTAYLDEILRAV